MSGDFTENAIYNYSMKSITYNNGFTLIELMLVLVVLGIAASLITLSFSATRGHALESAAENLSSTLEEARWHALSTGRRIAWEAPAGAAPAQPQWYEQSPAGVWQARATPLATLTKGAALDGITVTVAQPRPAPDAPARLVLGPEPVGAAACVILALDGQTLTIVSDGVAPFSVHRDARC